MFPDGLVAGNNELESSLSLSVLDRGFAMSFWRQSYNVICSLRLKPLPSLSLSLHMSIRELK